MSSSAMSDNLDALRARATPGQHTGSIVIRCLMACRSLLVANRRAILLTDYPIHYGIASPLYRASSQAL